MEHQHPCLLEAPTIFVNGGWRRVGDEESRQTPPVGFIGAEPVGRKDLIEEITWIDPANHQHVWPDLSRENLEVIGQFSPQIVLPIVLEQEYVPLEGLTTGDPSHVSCEVTHSITFPPETP